MKLRLLYAKDKPLFDSYLGKKEHLLSAYAFQNVFIWRRIFEIRWAVIEGALYVVFRDKNSNFLYLPPLSDKLTVRLIDIAFELLGKSPGARIDNIEKNDLSVFRIRENLRVEERFCDYICRRNSLVFLRGNNFKSKRSSCNLFTRNYDFEVIPYGLQWQGQCLDLYDQWAAGRDSRGKEAHYGWMLEDARLSLKEALDNFLKLGFSGQIVLVKGRPRAFTIGYPLNKKCFCVLFEVADLTCKGIAQFIFREFCRKMESFEYINMMDDSGLANLRRAKLSYKPFCCATAYSAMRI